MMRTSAPQRRIATCLLGLFLALLAMVCLHDLSHRAERMGRVAVSRCDEHPSSPQDRPTQVTMQATCPLCHYVHTPFLSLPMVGALVALVLTHLILLVRPQPQPLATCQRATSLRAPPTLHLI